MKIDETTKIMLRMHREANNRGLQIYNPYFQQKNINGLYLLLQNPNPGIHVEAIRNFKLAGAITSTFEHDPKLIELMDKLDPIPQEVGKVGIIANEGGKLKGYLQSAYGLKKAIKQHSSLQDKKVVIMGAGDVIHGFLHLLTLEDVQPASIEIYNRTLGHAEKLGNSYSLVTRVKPLLELKNASGDIFIHATSVGSPWNKEEDYQFTDSFLKGFSLIADTTFVPLQPPLIISANRLGIENSPGHEMFLYQGAMCLEKIMGIDVDLELLNKLIKIDFETNWS
ncbi:hypothetical protein KC717_00805 [Candidatus Dojkabacteria bacterium]|uniref:Quinate/shikimate 5-dehydrogenase/glutamyl-tRNA reductase domain-containing protein n=1 Tax=Candidatus Dojkabacteria bacterium TaxID=2099670 RepID=A0A955RKA3_9BACT|nr:hypothetical protein [Candidatus Dojkabacteria bacterium]